MTSKLWGGEVSHKADGPQCVDTVREYPESLQEVLLHKEWMLFENDLF